MPDMSTISSILSSIKIATEIAKLLKNSNVSFEKAEIKLKLADLVGALADAKLKIAEIQEALIEKDNKIKELQYVISCHSDMVWRDPVYYMQTEKGERGPFCPQCYDNRGKVIRLQTLERGCWRCETCNKTFISQDYNPSPIKVIKDFDP